MDQAQSLEEFANGAAQATVKTSDGQVFRKVLLSDLTYFIAMRGEANLPFKTEDVSAIYQTEDDRNPRERGGWQFWDRWSSPNILDGSS